MLTANACGTPGYMAPELSHPLGRATTASDVYSLGATIFELLTGVHPGQAADFDPWQYDKAIPEDLRNMVLHMVHPDPHQRPTTRKLLEWLGPGNGAPARVPLFPRVKKVLRWVGVGALAVAAGALAIVGIGAIVGSKKE